MVGDRADDIIAAKTHGVTVMAVAWGFGTPEEQAAHSPDHTVSTPEELLAQLRSLL